MSSSPLLSLTLPQDDWPQWRGVDGMAASRDTGLPVELGPEAKDMRWRAEVPGEGISAPIVKDGRVFLTTAYPGEMGGQMAAVRFAIPLFAVLALALLLVRSKNDQAEGGGLGRLVGRLDGLGLALGTLLFGAGACLVTFRSELFFEPGSPGYRWFYTGAIALFGQALAFTWFRPSALLRWLGVPLALGVGWLLFQNIPANRYAEPFRDQVKLVMIAPGIAWACWNVLAFLVAKSEPERRSTPVSALGALALILVSGATFAMANYLTPSAGLVRAVLCYDLQSGQLLWNTPIFVVQEEKKYPKNSYATPTPCATSEVVFAHFGPGYAALDRRGEILWQSVNESYHEETRYGAASSPVLLGNSVVYLHDNEIGLGPSYIQRIDLATGAVLWHVESNRNHDSYTTPLLVEREGEQQLISVSFDRLLGYDPKTGEELWWVPIPIEQMVPSIQIRGDLLLVSGGSHLKFSTSGIRLSGKGKDTKAEVLWQTKRAVPSIASPVLVDDLFFTVTDGGIMTCYDPETGDVHWQERLGGNFWASIAAGDGKVYAMSAEGELNTIRAAKEFEVLAKGIFDSPCYAGLSIASGQVLVRTEKELYCFGTPPSGGIR